MKSWPIERQYSDLQLTCYHENDPNGSEMICKAMNVNSVKEDFNMLAVGGLLGTVWARFQPSDRNDLLWRKFVMD